MVLAAPVWTYWLAFWWIVIDAVALAILGAGYVRNVLRPAIELRHARDDQARRAEKELQAALSVAPRPATAPHRPVTAAIPHPAGGMSADRVTATEGARQRVS